MIFHGTVVLIVGLFAGFAYGQAIVHKAEQRKVEAWRAAHTGLSAGGALIIVMGLAIRMWSESGAIAAVTAYSMIASGYGFSVAMTLAAYSGHRGFSMRGPISNWVAFYGHAVGVLGSVVGTLGFLYLAWLRY